MPPLAQHIGALGASDLLQVAPRTRRSRGGSSRPAASRRTGSASAATCSGRSRAPDASTAACAADNSPAVNAWAVWVSGPRNRARAVRTLLAAAPGPRRKRVRSQAAVDPIA
jgi:hypothetical protein